MSSVAAHPDARASSTRARTSSTARCARAALEEFVGQESVQGPARGLARGRARRAARRSTTCCWPGRPGLGKTSLAQIVAAELDVPLRADRRARRSSARATSPRFLTALEPRSRVLRRRDPPPQPRAGGDLLPGDGGPPAADHGRPGRGGAGRDARPAAVHARRRDDARRPADDAAARPLRHPAPPRALRARRPRADRAPLGGDPRRRARRRRRRGDRRAQPRHAARGQPPAQARARLRRGARRRASSTARRADAALELLEVDERGPRPPRPRDPATRSATKFGGGPVGLSTLAVAVGEEPDTIEDVYEPYLLQRGLLKRTPRGRAATARRLRAPRPRAAAATRRLF